MRNSIVKKNLIEFGFIIGFGFPFFIGLFLPFLSGHSFRVWTLFIGLPFIFLGCFKPSLLYYPYKFWMKLGNILGWINSYLILGIIHLLVLQPIALIMRISGYDPLRIKKIKKVSYREDVKDRNSDLTRIF